MSEILLHYHKVHPATWVYLSSLLMIGLFFKFNRFWSVRNLDLILMILLAPGLLLVHFGSATRLEALQAIRAAGREPPSLEAVNAVALGQEVEAAKAAPEPAGQGTGNAPVVADRLPDGDDLARVVSAPILVSLPESATDPARRYARAVVNERFGYVWLFGVGALLLVRLLIDPTMVRRPLLEPNLSAGGLSFMGIALFIFLMANVITSAPTKDDLQGPLSAVHLLSRQDTGDHGYSLRRHGPSYALLSVLPSIPTFAGASTPPADASPFIAAAKAMAIVSHLAVVIGIVAIGYLHFQNVQTGIGAAMLYLMLPYTAVMTGRVDHALPAALLLWAVVCYRRPLLAGMFIGLAAGVVYYPLFLLPLWISFYRRRGLTRFLVGVLSMLALMVVSLAFVSADWASFAEKVRVMFGIWVPRTQGLEGIWGLGWDSVYRIPVLALFATLSLTMAVWPAQKNLGTLLSCSAALMVATQFWHGYGGGMYIAWYLPLLLLTVFRPNLEDRVALSVLRDGWFPPSRRNARSLEQAA